MGLPTISYLTDVLFGAGASAELVGVTERLRIARPLVVTDRGVIASGLLEQAKLGREIVFDGVESNPTEASVMAALRLYRENGCDGVIGFGGGSPMDCAKCVALLATHEGPLEQYAFVRGGLPKITEKKPPVVCVPTTAGTGSEVGRAALVTMAGGEKLAVLSPKMIPSAAVCDPRLTLGLPPLLTAATGMDAVSHCVESYLSPRFNPVAEAIALDGLRRAVKFLRRAVERGDDLEARSEMLMSALEGGMTFQKGLGAVHALSHPLGAAPGRRLHHGTLNAVLLPHVLRFNAGACEEKMKRMGEAIGTRDVAAFFGRLSKEIGLPSRLGEMGVTIGDCEAVAERAVRDHCTATNPRQAGEAQYRSILMESL